MEKSTEEKVSACVEIADDKCWCCIVKISEKAGRSNFRNWQKIGRNEKRKKDKVLLVQAVKLELVSYHFVSNNIASW